MAYEFTLIDKKWQTIWDEKKAFKCDVYDFSKPKYYVLDMFPYPSAQGLHVGHPEGYTASDIIARMKRMQGYNVLHPIGWDAFGLPAEQYALKTGNHPEAFTKENIENFRRQIKSLGFSYDWDREISTTDPKYFKWTQWIFLKLYENQLAYVDYVPVNWCQELGTVLANEEVINGLSEVGGFPVIRKPMRQWQLKITAYAEKLLNGLDGLDWPTSTLEMQRNWIGKSTGAEVYFQVEGFKDKIAVFTTRVDTLFGCTYVCLAPEHPLVDVVTTAEHKEKVEAFKNQVALKSDLDRTELNKEKTGVFTGAFAINPVNGEQVPIYVADYVLMSYGSGAVMAVPAHDQRDYEFAKRHDLPIKQVLAGDISENAFVDDAPHINSSFANGLNIADAKTRILAFLTDIKAGVARTNYKLRDWLFSRQRYWGEPIPMLIGENNIDLRPLSEHELPLELPVLEEFKPSGTGESPLANATDWRRVEIDGKHYLRETNTMPQWAGSCWYYLRYLDPHNEEAIADPKLIAHWLPVDLYIGGAEHAVLHLLYARFWHQFLNDIGVTTTSEPFQKVFHQGMILGANGEKMSKSRGNVVSPDSVTSKYGADTLRLYEMFMGPLEASLPWSDNGLEGAKRWLDRVERIFSDPTISSKITMQNDGELDYSYHSMVKKVSDDYQSLSFNTAISQMMIFVNDVYKAKSIYRPYLEGFITMLSCIAPHLGEEIYHTYLGHDELITYAPWPTYDPAKLIKSEVEIGVQVNGKLRASISVPLDADKEYVEQFALSQESVQRHLEGKTIKKVIVVVNKIVNIVAI